MCVDGRGRFFQSGLTQYIEMGSCVFQCNIPHHWIANNRLALCLYTVTGWGVMSCAWHSCVAAHWSKNHCYKQAPSGYDLRCLKAMLNPNKQTLYQ